MSPLVPWREGSVRHPRSRRPFLLMTGDEEQELDARRSHLDGTDVRAVSYSPGSVGRGPSGVRPLSLHEGPFR